MVMTVAELIEKLQKFEHKNETACVIVTENQTFKTHTVVEDIKVEMNCILI